MYSEKPPHYSPFYRDFRAIDPSDKQRIIRRYEEEEQAIGQLDPHEYFDLTVRYVDALFASGAYRKHLLMVDLVIFTAIDQNILTHEGEDVYQRMLFHKAASAFRLRDFELAQHICRELIKIDPTAAIYQRFYRTSLFVASHKLLQFGRASFIFCILLAALAIVLDLLVVAHFFPAEHTAMIWLRNDLLLAGFLGLVLSYTYAYFRASREVKVFSQAALKKKTTKNI